MDSQEPMEPMPMEPQYDKKVIMSYLVKYEEVKRRKDVDVSFWTHQKKRPISGPKSLKLSLRGNFTH